MAGQQYPRTRNFNISAGNGEFVNHPIITNNWIGNDLQCPMNTTGASGYKKITHAPQIIENQVGGIINTDTTHRKRSKPCPDETEIAEAVRSEAFVEGNKAREITARVVNEGGGDPDIYHAPIVRNNKSEKIDTSTISKGGGDPDIHHAPRIIKNRAENVDVGTVSKDQRQRAVVPSREQTWVHIFRRPLQVVWTWISSWWNRGQ
ncbi:uncharacterized protein LOC121695843 isoform X1 [Alosa sapidissima]|uniref:uncharacterized protein LOC121695843 isoform X1 n=2 Tax=Alosa sapidissima TaxID=34773 RepID=UPI001C07FDF2|nr:uncharacterized protein LOC121695843 isoform X1 [Alosa sapidissima]XP_041932921.1 uncharacterized protein LOC121695843 isoform X1 [Alosa sapidissima]XP_041932922.1 uncharacterized protein LOC121695843 isoform X1 [Alosa sapidissima]